MSTHLTLAATTSNPVQNDVNAKATAAFMSLHIVTAGAQAVANCMLQPIPPVETDDPAIKQQMDDVAAKVADLQKKLDAAKDTAKLWLPGQADGGLGTILSSTIPHHLLDYGATYEATSTQILELLEEAKHSGSSKQLVDEALELIGLLVTQVQGYRTEMTAVAQRLSDYVARVQKDHDALVGGADAIQTLIGIDKTDADNLQKDIDRLHAEIDEFNKQLVAAQVGTGLGIFTVAVGIAVAATGVGAVAGGVTIAVGVAGVAAGGTMWGVLQGQIRHDQDKITHEQATRDALTRQAVALTGLHAVVANLIDQVTAAQAALSDVSTFWATFEATLQSVMDDLRKPNADLPIVLDEVWVGAAQNNWNNLVDLARNLLGVTVSTEFRPAAVA